MSTTATAASLLASPTDEVLLSPGMLMLADQDTLVMPPHLRELDEMIAVACRANEQRFVLNVLPIRHGKSVLSTAYTAAWYLLNYPDRSVLILCYSSDLASDFGEQVRDIIGRWGHHWGIAVSRSSSAKARFRLTVHGKLAGSLRAVGMNGSLTGKGFHLILGDDLLKSRDEADSKAARDKAWRRYTSTVRTRLDVAVGTVIVTNSRWHSDDLVGRLEELSKGNPDADQYEVLHRPALARRPAKMADQCPYTIDSGGCARERWIRRYRPGWTCDGHWHSEDGRTDGEALWPQRYGARSLLRMWAAIGDREFAAQLQGQPVLAGAGTVDTTAIRFVDRVPKGMRWCWAWDRALSDTGDYCAGALLARNAKGQVLVAMVARIRTADPDKRDRFIVDTVRASGPRNCPVVVETEGSEGKASARMLRRRMGRRPLIYQKPPTDRSKVQRAEPLFAAMNRGDVFVLRQGSVMPHWWPDFRAELDQVPVGTHDDMWDAAALAYTRLSGATGSRIRNPA